MIYIKIYKIKFAILLFLILIANCSNDKYQINGDERYFNTNSVKKLISPYGMILPKINDEFNIPKIEFKGSIGKSLDIRPPILPISLLANSSIKNNGDTIILFFNNNNKNNNIWLDILKILNKKNIPILIKNNVFHFIETGLIEWKENNKSLIKSRHKIIVSFKDKMIFIKIINLCLYYNNLVVTDINRIQFYNVLLFNELNYGLYELYNSDTTKNSIQNVYSFIDIKN